MIGRRFSRGTISTTRAAGKILPRSRSSSTRYDSNNGPNVRRCLSTPSDPLDPKWELATDQQRLKAIVETA